MCWHSYAAEHCYGWGYVNFADYTVGYVVFLDVRASCHEDWGYGGICIAMIGGDGVTVDTVEAFFVEVDDIAGVVPVKAEVSCFFLTYCQGNDTLAVPAVAVKIVDNLSFEFVLVSWVYDTMWVASLEVDVDVDTTLCNCGGLFPVDFAKAVAVFVFSCHHAHDVIGFANA